MSVSNSIESTVSPTLLAMLREVKPLYVSAGETGGIVKRYGSDSYIGATVTTDGVRPSGRPGPGRIVFNRAEVVMIPPAEYVRHRREYDKALADGDLVRRDEAAHKVWLEQVKADEAKAVADQASKDAEAAKAKAAARGEAKAQFAPAVEINKDEPRRDGGKKGNG